MKAKAIRLPENYLAIVKNIAEKEKVDESTIIRKFLKIGAEKYLIDLYEKGDLSIREFSKILGFSISEAIDFLMSEGVKGNVKASQIFYSLNLILKH